MPNDLVYLVDDDDAFRESAAWMLQGYDYEVKAYSEPEKAMVDLVAQKRNRRVVLLLDIRMQGMTGLEMHDAVNERGISFPVVYMTGHGDVALAVEAMSKGAVTLLEKPLDFDLLRDALDKAFLQPIVNPAIRLKGENRRDFTKKAQTLSQRELEIMYAVAEGKSSLVIAADLEIAVKTVDMHRGSVLKKLSLHNAQQLTKMVMLCL